MYNIGLIETEAHNKLNKFQIEKTYIKNGRTQIAYEIFDCSYDTCKNSLISSIKNQKDIIEKYEDEMLSKKYYFNKNKKLAQVNPNLVHKKKKNLIPKKNIITTTAKEITKKKIIKENLSSNYYVDKNNLDKFEKNNNNVFKTIFSVFVLISMGASLTSFFIFIAIFPANILLLISSIFFIYLMGYQD